MKWKIKNIALIITLFLSYIVCQAQISHKKWDDLLYQYVSSEGFVNYKGLKGKKEKLEKYLNHISQNPPENSWSNNEKKAYWINAYNAFAVKLIINNYPLESIRDLHPTLKIPGVNTVWKKEFFKIDGKSMSLHNIEHDILRDKFNDPRIHFGINCASFSCPKLRNEAYEAKKLNEQLNEQAKSFINNPDKNKIKKDHVVISKIFRWFKGDFTKNGDLINFLNKYSNIHINDDAEIDYMDYNWSLNEQEIK